MSMCRYPSIREASAICIEPWIQLYTKLECSLVPMDVNMIITNARVIPKTPCLPKTDDLESEITSALLNNSLEDRSIR